VRDSAPPPRSHRRTGQRRPYALRTVVRSDCSTNKLGGTIGSWIGSMAKLTFL
jgi:hypothetical protein